MTVPLHRGTVRSARGQIGLHLRSIRKLNCLIRAWSAAAAEKQRGVNKLWDCRCGLLPSGLELLCRCEAQLSLKSFSWLMEKKTYLHMPPDKKLKNCQVVNTFILYYFNYTCYKHSKKPCASAMCSRVFLCDLTRWRVGSQCPRRAEVCKPAQSQPRVNAVDSGLRCPNLKAYFP